MIVEIDPHAGFCFGVQRAVQAAEKILALEGSLFCLGDLVHNEEELARLKTLGLKTIDHEEFKTLRNCKILIRAHGEPPETYKIAHQNNIELIDATCPVVLKLQEKIEKSYLEIKDIGGQLVIFGKKSHAEVRGLEGQTGYRARVIEKMNDLNKLDFSMPIHLFAQTTMNQEDYKTFLKEIKMRIKRAGADPERIQCTQSICRQVSGRVQRLQEFCRKFDIMLFVSSQKSSNGRVLFDECKRIHEKSYFITGPGEVRLEWLHNARSIGITGATSTPAWLMEKVALQIREITKN
jgi:4-hydroxy-3-methylbut-2-enyl diphosphate reductase